MAPSRSGRSASGGGRMVGRGGARRRDDDVGTKKRRKLVVDLSSGGGRGGHDRRGRSGHDDDDDDDGIAAPALLDDEDVESDEDDLEGSGDEMDDEEEEEEEETADAKRLRLAREYLDGMEANRDSSSSEDDDDDDDGGDSDDDGGGISAAASSGDGVGRRIAEERLRRSGLFELRIADDVAGGIRESRRDIVAARCGSIGDAAARTVDDDGEAGTSTAGVLLRPRASSSSSSEAEDEARSWLDRGRASYHRGHDRTPTCVSLSKDGRVAYSGSKDGSLFAWDVEAGGRRTSRLLPSISGTARSGGDGNRGEILAIATSDDGRYLAVGGRDDRVRIFDVRTTASSSSSSSSRSSSYPVATFEGHKRAVTALAFRPRTLDLYSGSDDRCVRRYDLNSMTYVETLYGHQSPIVDVCCPSKNRPVTVSRDRTVRVWKVEEDSHLVYRPGGDAGAAECVSAMRNGWFVTGHDDGRLALWREEKKRPVGNVVVAAHGRVGGAGGGVTRGVMCCDALGMSDVLATGSNDGYLRFWRITAEEKDAGIKPLEEVPIHGYINSIAMGPGGRFCVAAVGQEPRLGRWDRVPRAKNRFAIIRLHGDETK